ncbi:MAG: peptidoglycan-binding protein, partial [Myxococcales bacterium]|nr:peptidoglycan-binding protein [Myxococcales bacterium]
TIKVKRLAEAAKEKRIELPAVYQTVTREEQVTEGRMEWRQILCQTNVRPGIVREIQQALVKAGYKPGPVDGVLGKETMAAVESFQKAKGLVVGPLTIRTLDALGVRVRTVGSRG